MKFSQTYSLKPNQIAKIQKILGEKLHTPDTPPIAAFMEVGNFWLHLADRYQIWITCTYEDDTFGIRHPDGTEFPKELVDQKLDEILQVQRSNGHLPRAEKADKNFATLTTVIKRSKADDNEIKKILDRDYKLLSKQEIIDIHNRAFLRNQEETLLSDKDKLALLIEAEITLKIRASAWSAVCEENDRKKFRKIAEIHQNHEQQVSKKPKSKTSSTSNKVGTKRQSKLERGKAAIGAEHFAELQAALAARRQEKLNITRTSTKEG